MSSAHNSLDEPLLPRFSLATGFFVIAVICVLLAEYQAMGVEAILAWWFTLVLSAAFVLHRTKKWLLRNIALGTFVVTGAIGMLPTIDGPGARAGWQSSECGNNLKILAIGTMNYSDTHRTLPPQSLADQEGKPALSWRVLLLPFIEQDALYRKFNLQQPWDGPANRGFASNRLDAYRCPAELNQRGYETSYVVIRGDDTCWPSAGPVAFSQIRDGTSNTLLFAETHDSGIPWPKPRDLEYDKLDWHLQGTSGNSVSSSHGPTIEYFDGSRKLKQRTSVNVTMADGSTHRLTRDIDPEVLRQMVHRRDGLPKEVP